MINNPVKILTRLVFSIIYTMIISFLVILTGAIWEWELLMHIGSFLLGVPVFLFLVYMILESFFIRNCHCPLCGKKVDRIKENRKIIFYCRFCSLRSNETFAKYLTRQDDCP
jgi:hypothetical protein